MQLHSDWIALLRELNAAGVKYLVIGAAALSYHGHPRGTMDFDVWVEASPENARRVYKALAAFGAPMEQVTLEDFEHDDTVWMIGVIPLRVDVLTGIEGVTFEEAWPSRAFARVSDIEVPVISKEDLIRNKRAAAREKDLLDLKALEPKASSRKRSRRAPPNRRKRKR
jgi:hypothetical protein